MSLDPTPVMTFKRDEAWRAARIGVYSFLFFYPTGVGHDLNHESHTVDWFLDGITLLLIKSLALVGFLYGDPLSLVVMEPSLLYDRRCVSMVS